MRTETIPVLVAGGGSAAFEAAVSAKQAGAPGVVMLEKAPEPEFGGNARFSHTGFRWVFSGPEEIRKFLPHLDDATFAKLHIPPYTAEQFHADLQRVTRGRIDKELAGVLVSQSNAAIHWMREVGIQWDIDSHVIIDGRYYFEPGMVIHPAGGVEGGLGQLLQWREIATKMGIELRYVHGSGPAGREGSICFRAVDSGGTSSVSGTLNADATGTVGNVACPIAYDPCESGYQGGYPAKASVTMNMGGAGTRTISTFTYFLRLQRNGRREMFLDQIEAIVDLLVNYDQYAKSHSNVRQLVEQIKREVPPAAPEGAAPGAANPQP